jgi:ABC-type lipoprotein release transport system permease subunit
VFLPDVPRSPAERQRVRERADAVLAQDPRITAASASILFSPFPQQAVLELGRDHLDVSGMVAFDGKSDVGPSVIDGRKPVAADELVLGPDTLRALGRHIGDHVAAYGLEGTSDDEGTVRRTQARMKIVGTAVVPQAARLGEGAAMTLDGLARLNPRFQDELYFVRVRPGTTTDDVVERFRRAFSADEAETISGFGTGARDPLLDLEAIDAVPTVLTAMTVVLAAIVLAHVFLSIVRARRRDVAILRVLGFSRAQTIRTVAWQSLVYAFVAVALGVPLGVFAGRAAWRVYARDLGVVPEGTTPWRGLVVTVVLALVLTMLLALPAAWRALRTRPAVLLRSE